MEDPSDAGLIREGDVVVIQRLDYMRTHKVGGGRNKRKSASSSPAPPPKVQLGKETVELSAVLGCPFGSFFRMVKEGGGGGGKKGWTLQRVSHQQVEAEVSALGGQAGEDNGAAQQGRDNRDLLDANSSQKLSKDEIEAMKEEGTIGSKMVSTLVDNSESFQKKTKFSQAKFLKKKTNKYYEFLQIRRPSVRLIMEIQYRSDPTKIMNLRVDSLAQLLNNANLRSGGRYMVYEAGCQGLVVAAALERVGGDGEGRVVHLFQTGNPQTQHLNAMNFAPEVMRNLTTLNMYHLRSLEQGHDITQMHRSDGDGGSCSQTGTAGQDGTGEKEKDENDIKSTDCDQVSEPRSSENQEKTVPYRQRLREESLASYNLLKEKNMDGLVIACRQHPTAILLSLLQYLAPSRPWAVFSPYKEPLLDAYMKVKETGRNVAVTLSESWLRRHQVLPGRTHPEMMMSGGGGYILSGIYVDNTEPESLDTKEDASDSKKAKLQ